MRKHLFIIFALIFFGCNESENPITDNSDPEFGEVFDVEGNKYLTINIGGQIWMAENLNVSKFRNGELIPEAKTKAEWDNASRNSKPVWCYYQNREENGEIYGKLYNWDAVNDSRGLAPENWNIPSVEDWEKLSINLGGDEIAGGKLKSNVGWELGANGTDEVNFKALPGNSRYFNGDFEPTNNNGQFALWWTSMEAFPEHSFHVQIHSSQDNFNVSVTPQGMGYSIRAIKK